VVGRRARVIADCGQRTYVAEGAHQVHRRRLREDEDRRRTNDAEGVGRGQKNGAHGTTTEGRSTIFGGHLCFLIQFSRLGARRAGGNLAPDAAPIGYANRLGAGLGYCWRRVFSFINPKIEF
jgi:hypothetical protein